MLDEDKPNKKLSFWQKARKAYASLVSSATAKESALIQDIAPLTLEEELLIPVPEDKFIPSAKLAAYRRVFALQWEIDSAYKVLVAFHVVSQIITHLTR